jgi:hypothetical protein
MGLMSIERHGEAQMARTLLFEPDKRVRIREWVGADFEGEIVAAEFALMTDARAYPPDSGMEEEKSFSHGLQDVPEEVGTAHVSQFVGENDFKFVGPKRRNGGKRKQHDCP